jgi:hypothetical protein
VAFFTFQKGNGTLHGSKGIGRDIYELAGMIDRTRNEVVDRLIISGKTLVQGDIKRLHTFKMSVVGTMIIIPREWTVLENKVDGNVDGFLKLDAYFNQLVNQLIGATTAPPTDVGEGMRSPAAWNLLAQREEQGQDVRISRFLEQFVQMVQTMQKRICSKHVSDDDAKEAQRKLLEIMTQEEMDELANSPAAEVISDLTPIQRQLLVSVAQEKKGNPLYNQRQLEVEDLTARINSDFADRVLLPDNDPTEKAEQMRMQNLEMVLLSHGQAVEVSPRDNHLIHLSILMPAAEQMGGQMMNGQFSSQELEAIVAHINEHYNLAIQSGIKKDQLAEVADFLKRAEKTLQTLKQTEQQASALASGNPMPGAPAQPPQPPPQQ